MPVFYQSEGTLHIEVGDTESLRIEAQDNVMACIETEVRNGRLRIGTQESLYVRRCEHFCVIRRQNESENTARFIKAQLRATSTLTI